MNKTDNRHKSYNARYMGFEDVAKTFVLNPQFQELVKPESSIIVGPRGCGKTTLLKMLHPQAYSAVQSYEVKNAYNEMYFWGVYIPADKQWTTLLQKIKDKGTDTRDKVVNTLISINVLSSICSCFKSLIDISIDQISNKNAYHEVVNSSQIQIIEMYLARDLKKIWRIEDEIPYTLYGIQQYWNKVITDLNLSINNENNTTTKTILSKYNEYIDYTHAAFCSFKQYCNTIKFCSLMGFRWALCFDELELAPKTLRSAIYNSLRSTRYQEIIFKTTASYLLNESDELEKDLSYGHIGFGSDNTNKPNETDAVEGHDFQYIFNWVHDKESENLWEDFCQKLYSKPDEKRIIDSVGNYDIIKFLPEMNDPIRKNSSTYDYKPGSLAYQVFAELAKTDESFKSFLIDKEIDPQNPFNEKETTYNLLKKIKTTAVCRYYLSKNRSIIPFYFGKEILFDFSEGNPRLAINIINRMISKIREQDKLDIKSQSIVYTELADEKMRFFEHYPNANIPISPNSSLTLGDVLKKIGDYFKAILYTAPFCEEPKNTFYVDNNLHPQLINLIRIGIELGAIMKVDYSEVPYPVYKLAYILYPYFSLPKRRAASNPEKLSNILNYGSVINKKQYTIPFKNDNQ